MKSIDNKFRILAAVFLLLGISLSSIPALRILDDSQSTAPTIEINIEPYSTIYEGDIIDCIISGDPTIKYWTINNQSEHTTFHNDCPLIFDPEPTPLNDFTVNLTVYVENTAGNDSDTVIVTIKRLYFGDLHFHSWFSDGVNKIDDLYENTLNDNYLDFICLTDHAEILDAMDPTSKGTIIKDIFQNILYKLLGISEWATIKDMADSKYKPGRLTTFLGFEYTPGPYHPGGDINGPNGHEDVSHINFYYRDVYPEAPKYSANDKHTYDDIFQAMSEEWDKGHLNLGFPHHPLMFNGFEENTVNWTFLANGMINTSARDKILRGVETYSCWGTSIGKYSDIPIVWPYLEKNLCDQKDAWVENALWEWSQNKLKGRKFGLMASSDIHMQSRAGSAIPNSFFWRTLGKAFSFHPDNPAGLVAVYSVHNKREEIWDAMYECEMYGTHLLKTRVTVKFDGELVYGQWINCSNPLKIQITGLSTFSGKDSSGKSMCPHGYSEDELDYPIKEIWIIKKDRDRGRPYCKVIANIKPNQDLVVYNFEDTEVQPNDFYYIALNQKGQNLKTRFASINPNAPGNEYMTFIGPVFIDTVESE